MDGDGTVDDDDGDGDDYDMDGDDGEDDDDDGEDDIWMVIMVMVFKMMMVLVML